MPLSGAAGASQDLRWIGILQMSLLSRLDRWLGAHSLSQAGLTGISPIRGPGDSREGLGSE